MNLKDLHKSAESFRDTEKMPVLFIGHGSPMNAIEENEFVAGWRILGRGIAETTGHFMYFRTLGNTGNMGDCHGKACHHP